MALRTSYHKTGRMRFLGHLDLARTVHRALLRAELPIAFSEGFNPQPRVAFGPPVALGVEALEEWVDLQFTEPVDAGGFLQRVGGVLCPGLGFDRAFELPDHSPSLGSIVRWALYRVGPRDGPALDAARVEAVVASPRLELARRGKHAGQVAEVRARIRRLGLDGSSLVACLACGPEGALGIVDLLQHLTGLEPPAVLSGYRIVREKLYAERDGLEVELGPPTR
ncbi:MAG: DUF2344 domain-containing protein [Candidatus Riflebacteria bacterium]|nr:DUF2344 domain-containing protein [Candidatus Riflebacteria bacterium]